MSPSVPHGCARPRNPAVSCADGRDGRVRGLGGSGGPRAHLVRRLAEPPTWPQADASDRRSGPRHCLGPLRLPSSWFLLLVATIVRIHGQHVRALAGEALPGRLAALLALAATAFLFWSIGSGVLAGTAMRMADASFSALDATFEEGAQTAGPAQDWRTWFASLAWEGLGRTGGRATIAQSRTALTSRRQRKTGTRAAARLCRIELGGESAGTGGTGACRTHRIGAFERSNLVIITPTGTGWVPPRGRRPWNICWAATLRALQYSTPYLASWLALLADPELRCGDGPRGFQCRLWALERSLPRESRPRLYLYGLSLGSSQFGSEP